ncbi:amino acid transporter, putative [Plasmodium ovale curtisi]|uniref:Amino acid transporter, putative n=1 Tax=Plasmodium ovale curtisi TaxID=864141 RepID=A0A1A8X3W7_PLAOA|nr:amino acid transporter, putative [Plasmodium ovale curtisi]SBS98453.1 amino acid transporter, putative [Plasmodium ovale curtisi]
MNIKWLPNISFFNFDKKNRKKNFVRSRKRFRTITWKYTKTIGPFASFIYLFNQSIGSGLFDIPSLIDEVGWVPVIFGNLFVCSVAAFCSLMILRAMTMIPKNKNFEQRIEYSAVIKYFMSNEKYRFVSFLYHLGNICNNICGILVISKIIDIFIIKLLGYTILFQVYPQVKIMRCSLPFLDAMYNGYYYSSTGHYQTIVIGGFTIGYVINAMICIHMSSKGLEETINYQYVVFMIFMSSFLYLSVSSSIYLLSQNYSDNLASVVNIGMQNNLILNRAHFETDLVKNYNRYNELNLKKKLQPYENGTLRKNPITEAFQKARFSEDSQRKPYERKYIEESIHTGNTNKILQFFKRRGKGNVLQFKNRTFCCTFVYLNSLYHKRVYIFRNTIFYFALLSCSKGLAVEMLDKNGYTYSTYNLYHEGESNSLKVSNGEVANRLREKEVIATRKREETLLRDKMDKTYGKNGVKMDDKKERINEREWKRKRRKFLKNLYYIIRKIEGIKTYCMGKTFANFIDSYGFVSNIPSWGNEITDDVNVSKAIWFTVIFSSIFYFLFGIIFCLNNSFQKINTSVLYIFNFVAVAPKVITGSISMRYDLMNLDICSDNAAFFFACIAPFMFAWIFSNGIIFSNTFNYISLICGLFCNFLSPAFAYISACESNTSFYKNPLRKYTIVNRKKTVFSSTSDIRKALGNIIDNFTDNYKVEESNIEKETENVNEELSQLNRSLSLNHYVNQEDSLNSSYGSTTYFKFENGEYIPKSYSKDDCEFNTFSSRRASDFRSTFHIHDFARTDENPPKGGISYNVCQKPKGKKKKGVIFSDEIAKDHQQANEHTTYADEFGDSIVGEMHRKEKRANVDYSNIDTLNSDISHGKEEYHSRSSDKCSKKKKVLFSEAANGVNDDRNSDASEDNPSQVLELKKNIRGPKDGQNIKKKIMFSDNIEICGEKENREKKKKKRGGTFEIETKERLIEETKNKIEEKKKVKFSVKEEFSVEGRSTKASDGLTKIANGEKGNISFTTDSQMFTLKWGGKKNNISIPPNENENTVVQSELKSKKPDLPLTDGNVVDSLKCNVSGENEIDASNSGQKKYTNARNCGNNTNDEVRTSQEGFPENMPIYEIKITSKNDQVSDNFDHFSLRKNVAVEDNFEKKENNDKGNCNRLHIHFAKGKKNGIASFPNKADLPKEVKINTTVDAFVKYERNLSDSAISYNVKNEINKMEQKEKEIITKNSSFELREQIFKRQREKLKSQYKCSISNVLGNFNSFDKLLQDIETLKLEEGKRDNFFNVEEGGGAEEQSNFHSKSIIGENKGKIDRKTFISQMRTYVGNEINEKNTLYNSSKNNNTVSSIHISQPLDTNRKSLFSEKVNEDGTTENDTDANRFVLKKNDSKILKTGTFATNECEKQKIGEPLFRSNLKGSKDDKMLTSAQELSGENYKHKYSLQSGLHACQNTDKIVEYLKEDFHSGKVPLKDYNNVDGKTEMSKKNHLLLNNTDGSAECDTLLNGTKLDVKEDKGHNVHISLEVENNSSGIKENEKKESHYAEKFLSINKSKQDDILYLQCSNRKKYSSCEVLLSPEGSFLSKEKIKTLNSQVSVNEYGSIFNNSGNNNSGVGSNGRSNTLFVRQRKKLMSSFHANGNMIIGNNKEAIHKEQINEFRKQISKESYMHNYYNEEQISDSAKEVDEKEKERTIQGEMNEEKTILENDDDPHHYCTKVDIPVINIMKSYETQSIKVNHDTTLKDVEKPKAQGDVRRKTNYKFVDLSNMLRDIDQHDFEFEENEDMANKTDVNNDENSYLKSANYTILDPTKNINLGDERKETAEIDTLVESEKPEVIRKIEEIYTTLANRMHSENSEISTSDDIDYVDIRYFKIIDNSIPVKHYYNTFRRSKILDSKKYDHIYSNNIMLDNKTNMDHLCSIFLFGNPLERNEEYAGDKKNVDTKDELKNTSSSSQKAYPNVEDKPDVTINCEDKKNKSSISESCEEIGLIKHSFSKNLGNNVEIIKTCTNAKSSLHIARGLSLRKPNVNFNINNEIMSDQELSNVIGRNNARDLKKNISDKIEVMKIRIHVYPSLLQKYHVETTYVLLGCLTIFSFVGIITDLLFG